MKRSEWGAKARARDNAEARFQARVEELAQQLGWYAWHLTQAQRSQPGLPDLILIRERVVWAELKATSLLTGRTGKLSPAQIMFRDMLQEAGQEWHLWTDSSDDWQKIQEVLKR